MKDESCTAHGHRTASQSQRMIPAMRLVFGRHLRVDEYRPVGRRVERGAPRPLRQPPAPRHHRVLDRGDHARVIWRVYQACMVPSMARIQSGRGNMARIQSGRGVTWQAKRVSHECRPSGSQSSQSHQESHARERRQRCARGAGGGGVTDQTRRPRRGPGSCRRPR